MIYIGAKSARNAFHFKPTQAHQILLNRNTCDGVEDLLAFRFEILKESDGTKAVERITALQPHVVILDMRLKHIDGLDICRQVRNAPATRHIPILVYSGSEDFDCRMESFEAGADDFILKTVRPKELIARILSKVRRIEEEQEPEAVLRCGNLILDNLRLEASIDGRAVPLSVLEFNLLRFFVTNVNRVKSRQEILEGVWKNAIVSDRTIDTHMVYLRKKLSGFTAELATVYGAGYILRENRSAMTADRSLAASIAAPGSSSSTPMNEA